MSLYINRSTINHLTLLEKKLKKPLLKQLTDLYYTSSSTVINEMREALKNKELKALNRIAHSFKSSSANLGIDAVASLCELIEYKSIEEAFGDSLFFELENHLDSICKLLPHVLNELNELQSESINMAS